MFWDCDDTRRSPRLLSQVLILHTLGTPTNFLLTRVLQAFYRSFMSDTPAPANDDDIDNWQIVLRLVRHFVRRRDVAPDVLIQRVAQEAWREASKEWWEEKDEQRLNQTFTALDFKILTYGMPCFQDQDPTLILELNLDLRRGRGAIHYAWFFAERHRWKSAMGSLVMFCRHLTNKKEKNPFPLGCACCVSAEQEEIFDNANLTETERLEVEKAIQMNNPIIDMQAWIDTVLEMRAKRYSQRTETRARKKKKKEATWLKNQKKTEEKVVETET